MSVKSLGRLILDPTRIPREVLLRWPRASFGTKLKWDAVERPGYAYGAYQAARQARALGPGAISGIEVGVAGGSGPVGRGRQARGTAAPSPIHTPASGMRAWGGVGGRHE